MSLYRQIESIKAQIADTARLLGLIGDHPFMSIGLEEKLADLRLQLNTFPEVLSEPSIQLLFSGKAVVGSMGIKSSFISKTVTPFQEMVKTQFAFVRFGNVGRRGQAKDSHSTELYLTALPTGSFGVELSQLEGTDLFAELDVASAIKQVANLISTAATSDESFEESIGEIPSRNLTNLKNFLREIVLEDSMLKMNSGTLNIELSNQQVKDAYDRVSSTTSEENEVFFNGILRGLLLDSGRFEFQNENGEKLAGRISSEVDESQVTSYKLLINETCRVHLRSIKTVFKTGKERLEYELLELTQS